MAARQATCFTLISAVEGLLRAPLIDSHGGGSSVRGPSNISGAHATGSRRKSIGMSYGAG
jgi:hypothetical protein